MSYVNLKTRLAGLLLGLAALSLLLAPVAQAAPARIYDEVAQAANWVAAQQQPDGAFPGFGVGSTADAMVALAAAARNTAQRTAAGVSAPDFLASKAKDYAKTPGAAAKLILGVTAGGQSMDAHNFGGV